MERRRTVSWLKVLERVPRQSKEDQFKDVFVETKQYFYHKSFKYKNILRTMFSFLFSKIIKNVRRLP